MEPRAAQTAAVIIAFTAVGTIFLCLRLFTRFFLVRAPGWEDWIIILSWLNAIATTVCMIMQIHFGLGKHASTLSNYQNERLALVIPSQILYISLSTYNLSLGLTKLAVLMQYRRIFLTDHFHIYNSICIFLIIAYTFSTVAPCLFICWPVQKFWKPTSIEGHCINITASWVANAIMSIMTDLIIFALPMPVLGRLHLEPRQKILLIGVFAFGAVVCLISILRLHSLIILSDSTDPSYDNTSAAAWSIAEVYVSIICSCLPTLRPLLSKWYSGLDATHQPDLDFYNVTIGSADDRRLLQINDPLHSRDSRSTISSRRSSIIPFTEELALHEIVAGRWFIR